MDSHEQIPSYLFVFTQAWTVASNDVLGSINAEADVVEHLTLDFIRNFQFVWSPYWPSCVISVICPTIGLS